VVAKHVMVYFEPGRYGGWPANHGNWSWGNEILVGFMRGYYKDMGSTRHHIDLEKPRRDVQARSLDGGESWSLEEPTADGFAVPHHEAETDCPGGINFTHPDFALRVRMSESDAAPNPSFFHYSYDRGKTWQGPFKLPTYGAPRIRARTDYLVNGKHDCMLFLTATKPNGREGRPFCARTEDGGKTWNFVSWIGPEPQGYGIMPASVRLSDSDILVLVRRRDGDHGWMASYLSQDNGRSWEFVNDPVDDVPESNPAALLKLRDGRLSFTYGIRRAPFRICAKLSSDQGRTWSDELVLRDDGTDRDLGYTRDVQRPDGKIVSVYYFDDAKTGPERYIAATIWEPPA